MENLNKEHERVLKNPPNTIMSDGLASILNNEDTNDQTSEYRDHESLTQGLLEILGQEYICNIKKVRRQSKNIFDFKLEVPTFPVNYLLECDDIRLKFCNHIFSSEETSSISFRDNGILTFTARRTVDNEEV